jgi:hypothetical protein
MIQKGDKMKRSNPEIKEKIDRIMELLTQDPQVRVKNPKLVRRYLSRFNDMIDIVPEAVNAAKRHFPEAQLVLDLYIDPEIDDKHLVLYVRMWDYSDSVMEGIREARRELRSFIDRLEEAESEFLNKLAGKGGWIQLTTDFRKPEE